jgi:RNA polymerase primary sigma factor
MAATKWSGRRTRRDTLEQYLAEIAASPLLTPADEVDLARRIARGDDAAFQRLVRANLRFVVSIAKRFASYEVPLLDLIAEGNLGLMRAAERYHGSLGVRFVSYAVWWIRQAIIAALAEQGRAIRLPLQRVGAAHRLARRADRLERALGRPATRADLTAVSGLSAREIDATALLPCRQVSLDAPIVIGREERLADRLADTATPSPDATLVDGALRATIAASLATLPARDARVLRLYYGFDDGESHTLEEIGALLGVTRERARQLKERGLAHLRTGERARALETFRAG